MDADMRTHRMSLPLPSPPLRNPPISNPPLPNPPPNPPLAALDAFLSSPLALSYLLNSSPANTAHVLYDPASVSAAVSAAQTLSLAPHASTSTLLSLFLPQIALADFVFGVIVTQATSPRDEAAQEEHICIGRFAGKCYVRNLIRFQIADSYLLLSNFLSLFPVSVLSNATIALAHNPMTLETRILSTSPTSSSTRDRLTFSLPTPLVPTLLTQSSALTHITFTTETLTTTLHQAPPSPPAHPTDFAKFPSFFTSGVYTGKSYFLRPLDPTDATDSSLRFQAFSHGDTHARLTAALQAAALHSLSADSLLPEVTQNFGVPVAVRDPPLEAEAKRVEQICQSPEIVPSFEGSMFNARTSRINLELPPELKRRTVRRRSEAEVVERDAKRTSKNRAAAARANARRRFVREQLKKEERRVIELERRRLALVIEGEVLKRKVAGMLCGAQFGEGIEAA